MTTTTTKKLWTFLLSFGHEVNSDGRHGVFSQLRPSLAAMCEGTTAPACENRPQTNRCSLVSSGGGRGAGIRPRPLAAGYHPGSQPLSEEQRGGGERKERRKTRREGQERREKRTPHRWKKFLFICFFYLG